MKYITKENWANEPKENKGRTVLGQGVWHTKNLQGEPVELLQGDHFKVVANDQEGTIKRREALISLLDSMKERHAKAREYRWKNYYDCIDDYSVGGIMDQAESQAESRLISGITTLGEQIENGGYIYKEVDTLVLRDLETGKVVSDQIVNTKFGEAFIIKSGDGSVQFVSLAKRQETYAKKGYQCYIIRYKLRLVFDGTENKKFWNRKVTLIDSTGLIKDRPLDDGYDNRDLDLWLMEVQQETQAS